jgi:lipopolysaccharide/colanic/teichoic acid biosynthesis glycosyltransferase
MSNPPKRIFDLAGAVGGLVAFAPAFALVSLAVLLDDGLPVFFKQERLGRRRRPFVVLKFRTMRDGRVTRIGRWLRASGLDEIPQLLNILRGDMSAVGPRPLTAADVDRLGWSTPDCDVRWAVRPGLTGLAQILGASNGSESLALDRKYLERWRPALDCQLIALSFAVNAFGKARVRAALRARLQRLEAAR